MLPDAKHFRPIENYEFSNSAKNYFKYKFDICQKKIKNHKNLYLKMNKLIKPIIKSIQIKRFYCYKAIKRVNINLETQPTKIIKPSKESNIFKNVSLAKQIRSKIEICGPISLADYMKTVLTNPSSGYYMSKDVFGEHGDFITSPEISSIFGELLGIWLLSEWKKIGSPEPLQIIELGPGRGTLSKDILRIFQHFRKSDKLSLHLVEISPFLSQLQAKCLCEKSWSVTPDSTKESNYYREGITSDGLKVFWYQRLEDVPKKFSIVVAHEFFDALPVHKFERNSCDNSLREILIDIDPNTEENFRFVISRAETPICKVLKTEIIDERSNFEYSMETEKILNLLSERFISYGGFGLIIDYGHFGDKTDTFRGFKNHKLHDPLIEPGSADLTCDVDFKQIKRIAEKNGLITFGPVDQGRFLQRMGGEIRLENLLKKAKPDQLENIKSGYSMLTQSDKMGSRFKFFSIFPQVLKEHLEKYPVTGFVN